MSSHARICCSCDSFALIDIHRDELTAGHPWLFEHLFPGYSLENVMAVANKMINGTESK